MAGYSACNQPLDYFFLSFAIIFTVYSVLLWLQLAVVYSESVLRMLLVLSYLPALAELTMLVVGTVWVRNTQSCNQHLKQDAVTMLYVLWAVVGFGVVVKLLHWLFILCAWGRPERVPTITRGPTHYEVPHVQLKITTDTARGKGEGERANDNDNDNADAIAAQEAVAARKAAIAEYLARERQRQREIEERNQRRTLRKSTHSFTGRFDIG